jgi:LL-diaminopimelate aminotransferase
LPAYLFVEIDRKRAEALAAGRDVIDLGVGDPDLPTPGFVVERMAAAVRETATHRYPPAAGLPILREAVAEWFERRFGVGLDPASEVLILVGSKEGIGHLPLALVDPGQTVLVPDPGYPVYRSAAVLAGARTADVPLSAERGWMPELEAIPAAVRRDARLMFLNYPNNPTAAVAELAALRQVVGFAREHDIFIAQDAAYSELYFDDPPASILQVAGAKEVAVEFHSFSKTFSMTGWRIGFVVGNAAMLRALAKVKNNVDSGTFGAVQLAGVEAIRNPDHPEVIRLREMYRCRRDAFCTGLRRCGFEVVVPRATFYVWCRCPPGYDSMRTAAKLLDEAGVVLVPGVGFGRGGEKYVRAAMTVPVERIEEAVERIAGVEF